MVNRIARNEAEFCGKVPLHQTNLLQPHGYLLILDDELDILQAGENVHELFGSEVASLISRNFTQYLPGFSQKQLIDDFENAVAGGYPMQLDFQSSSHLTLIKKQPGYYIVEIEKNPVFSFQIPLNKIYRQIRELLQQIESATSLEKFCHSAIAELKKISGFDKIMIYRFDENWNGDVIAEVMEEGMDSYLGLKFPASDIPKQARDLYFNTAYRIIPDTKYQPVKIYPVVNKITGRFTDLSTSNLRSVAAVHLEYLSNMKVRASMSTRIIVKGQLWGLISCHHRTPKFPDYDFCTFFEIFSQLLSARITWIKEQDAFCQKIYFNDLQSRIIQNILESQGPVEGLKKSKEELLKLFSADGVVFVYDRQVMNIGTVPGRNNIDDLLIWIQSNNIDQVYHQDNMSSVHEPALDYAEIGSGVLVLPLHKERGDYLLAFRPEVISKINWGGNPGEAVQFEPGGKAYHPRTSFALWQQTVHHTAISWEDQEIAGAENFMKFLRPLLYRKNSFLNY